MKRQLIYGLFLYGLLVSMVCLSLMGCPHQPPMGRNGSLPVTSSHCSDIEKAIDLRDRIDTLDNLVLAFNERCYETVIVYGTKAQTEYRYKTYSILRETGNIFVPDGVLTDYTLESYERGYLSFLLSASYYRLHKGEDTEVELRRLDHELFTELYNFGEDPVNILLSAVLWEKLGEMNESRVDWNRLQGQKELKNENDEQIRKFATNRLNAIDTAQAVHSDWKFYAVGHFPEIGWNIKFVKTNNGYFSVWAKQPFLPDCASDTGIRISTQSWFEKIAMRHNNRYHPLLNLQSWIRLPLGIVYSIIPLTTGAAIVVSGCAADAYAHGNGSLCNVSIKGGVAVMKESSTVLEGTIQPDLRHWENVPSSFLLTTSDNLAQERCYLNLPADFKNQTFRILD